MSIRAPGEPVQRGPESCTVTRSDPHPGPRAAAEAGHPEEGDPSMLGWTLFAAGALLATSGTAPADMAYEPEASLRGLDGVTIVVAEPDSSFIQRGITAGVVRAPIELVLREASIPVLDSGDAGSSSGNPILLVTVTGVLDDPMQQYAVHVQMELAQEVCLRRDPQLELPDATTWRIGGITLTGPHWRDALLSDVRFYAQSFVQAYWTANGTDEP